MVTDESTESKELRVESAKRPYEKPVLLNHGTVGELTQSGGALHRDGVFTRKLS